MKSILITGGAGFIGVNAVEYFVSKGWKVTIFDNFSRKGTDLNLAYLEGAYSGGFTVTRGDVRTDTALLQELCEEHDAVLHLAAQVAVTTSVKDPREDFDINALGTFNVLEAARLSRQQPAVLYASTNKVYGGLENLPVVEDEKRYRFAPATSGQSVEGVTEEQPLDFHSPYGCSNGAADQYVRDYARIYGLKTVVFRQSCIYGPHQMGIEDQGWVAWFLIAALFKKPVQIYGNGKQVRDLLHVTDLVHAYDRALETIDSCSGQIYNLGGGAVNTLSLLEFMDLLNDDLDMHIGYTFSETRPGDQPIFISDNSKAERELGWHPAVEVKEGVASLATWLRENRGMLEGIYGEPVASGAVVQ